MSALTKEKESLLISTILRGSLTDLFATLRNFDLNPSFINDPKGNSALHLSILNNSFNQLELLIRYLEQYHEKSDIREWVNRKNQDAIPPLYFAVFKGNFAAVKLLLSKGADVNILTGQGLSMMHAAAQGDQMLLLAYFRELGLSFVQRDFKGATPLHWAAYLGCELSSSVLISWKAEINCTDGEGYTPLHLAAIVGNVRITRMLMLKGAETELSDARGRTAIDFAKEYGFTNIIELLKPPGILSLCGIKPPQRPIQHKKTLLFAFLSLLSIGIPCNILILQIQSLHYLCASFFAVLFFVIIISKDPGYLPRAENSLLDLCKLYEPTQICVECVIKRPPRSRHCQSCKRCVQKFDHHCPWINNCVGASNLGFFLPFILVTLYFLLISTYFDIYYIKTNFTNPETYSQLIIALLLTIICLGFFFPLALLVMVQIQNFLTNTTTNERYSRSPEVRIERSDSDENVDRSSILGNVVEMCCNVKEEEAEVRKLDKGDRIRFENFVAEYEKGKQ